MAGEDDDPDHRKAAEEGYAEGPAEKEAGHEPSHPGEVDREIPAPQSARDHPPLQGDGEQLVQGPHDGHGDPAEHRQVGEGEDPGIVEPGHQLWAQKGNPGRQQDPGEHPREKVRQRQAQLR